MRYYSKITQGEWLNMFSEETLNNVEITLSFNEKNTETTKLSIDNEKIQIISKNGNESNKYYLYITDDTYNTYIETNGVWTVGKEKAFPGLTKNEIVLEHALLSRYPDKYIIADYNKKDGYYTFKDYKERTVKIYVKDKKINLIEVRGDSKDSNNYINISFSAYGKTTVNLPDVKNAN